MKIALGTVQFGMNYGIGNQTGQVDQENTTNDKEQHKNHQNINAETHGQ